MNKKGIALIVTFMVIVVLVILGTVIISKSISESNNVRRQVEFTQAFWLAEAGVSKAFSQLRANYNDLTSVTGSITGSPGGYSATIQTTGASRTINAHGFIPSTVPYRVERIVEVIMNKNIPSNFYDNAIYSAGEVDFNGNAYSVNGNVIYADEIDNTGNVSGTITHDPTINPLARLNFEDLRNKAIAQGNLYTAADLASGRAFPTAFYNISGEPNVVYLEGDLVLNGNIGTIGGFFVVAGDVITDPNATQDATINGNGQIDGLIYTRGEFRVNGGGGGLNVNGGVWAGDEARLNGNATVNYNVGYMDAVETIITADVQITSWKDTQNPYQLTP